MDQDLRTISLSSEEDFELFQQLFNEEKVASFFKEYPNEAVDFSNISLEVDDKRSIFLTSVSCLLHFLKSNWTGPLKATALNNMDSEVFPFFISRNQERAAFDTSAVMANRLILFVATPSCLLSRF